MDDIVSATANAGTKLKVFISYSRSDQTFVDRLGEALQLHDIEALVDRSHIEKFADWWERIQQLIGAADTVVFALSPDALKSGTCQREVAYASQLNKRFAPIVVRDVYNVEVPEELKRLNYIFFRDGDDFGAALDDLVAGLRSDIVWVREHRVLRDFVGENGGDAGIAHGYSVPSGGGLHGGWVVCDHQELRGLRKILDQIDESLDIRSVQRCVDFIQQYKWTWSNRKETKQDCDCRKGSFAAR